MRRVYDGLFHLTYITHSFALFLYIIGAIVLQLTAYYPRRSQKSMGAMGKKMSSFFLTKYTDSYFYIFKNNLIKMWDKFRFLEFALIILLIGQIFLMSSSDLISMLSTTAGLLDLLDLLGWILCYLLLLFQLKFIIMLRLIKVKFLKRIKTNLVFICGKIWLTKRNMLVLLRI